MGVPALDSTPWLLTLCPQKLDLFLDQLALVGAKLEGHSDLEHLSKMVKVGWEVFREHNYKIWAHKS